MATLNVFEVTSSELSKALKESEAPVAKKANKKTVKESVKKIGGKFARNKKIASNKLRVESLQFVKEAEENDEVIDYTPDEDVVLVIDPEMDETPADVEEAEESAEALVGDYVCKCSICGANYVCDCETVEAMEEDLEETEAECPVCGETGEQIIVGEITPAEDVEAEGEEDEEEEVVVDDEEIVDDSDADDVADVDIDINVDGDLADEDEDYEESIQRAKRRTALRRESAKRAKLSAKRPMAKRTAMESKRTGKILPRSYMKKSAVESKLSAKRPAMESKVVNKLSAKRPMTKKAVKENKGFNIDETALNRMLTKFAKENYGNVRFVKINKGGLSNGKLTLEGIVTTTKGSRRTTKFVCENFKNGRVVSAKFTEIGAFTESAMKGSKNVFTINFVTKNNVLTPTALTYNFNVKENKEAFNVSGRVVNESLRKNRK